jgi:hypothetical protein
MIVTCWLLRTSKSLQVSLAANAQLEKGERLKISAHKTRSGLWDLGRNWAACDVRCGCTKLYTYNTKYVVLLTPSTFLHSHMNNKHAFYIRQCDWHTFDQRSPWGLLQLLPVNTALVWALRCLQQSHRRSSILGCYIVSTGKVTDVSGASRYLYLQFRKGECLEIYQNSSTPTISNSHRSCPYNICRTYSTVKLPTKHLITVKLLSSPDKFLPNE